MPKIAFVLFPDITATDVVAPLDALQTLCHTGDWEVVAVSPDADPVPCLGPLSLSGDNTYAQVPEPDVVVVPGGPGSIDAMGDSRVLEYLRVAHDSGALVASVCTGALVLGAAGILEGRRATTHWAFIDVLSRFGAAATDARWVRDGRVWTSAGVTAGLDMALALAEALADGDTAELIRLNLEYGSEAVTSEQLRERYRAASRTMLRDRLPAGLAVREAILSELD